MLQLLINSAKEVQLLKTYQYNLGGQHFEGNYIITQSKVSRESREILATLRAWASFEWRSNIKWIDKRVETHSPLKPSRFRDSLKWEECRPWSLVKSVKFSAVQKLISLLLAIVGSELRLGQHLKSNFTTMASSSVFDEINRHCQMQNRTHLDKACIKA